MANEMFISAYEAAAKELEELLHQQERTEARILALRQTMNSLAALISQHGDKEKNFMDYAQARLREVIDTSVTDDIRKILAASTTPLTTSEIRKELDSLGGSLAEQSNPLATISAVLNRLSEQGYAAETVKNGRKAWLRYKPSLRVLTDFDIDKVPVEIAEVLTGKPRGKK